MTFSHHRLTTVLAVSALAPGIAACGGGDGENAATAKKATAAAKPATAASCARSWNADANAVQQATLAGAVAAEISFQGKFRVGTWPRGERNVSVTEGFSQAAGRAAVVKKGSCLLVLPDSRVGQMAFVESDGRWGLVGEDKSTFPDAALRFVAGVRFAEPDALGKLKLR